MKDMESAYVMGCLYRGKGRYAIITGRCLNEGKGGSMSALWEGVCMERKEGASMTGRCLLYFQQ